MAISPKNVNSEVSEEAAAIIKSVDGRLALKAPQYENRQGDMYTLNIPEPSSVAQMAIIAAYEEAGWRKCYFTSENPDPGDMRSVVENWYIHLVRP